MADTRTEIGLRVSVDELALLCAVLGEHVRANGGREAGELLRRLETARSRPSRARAKGMRATVLRVDGTQSVEEFAGEPGLEWLQREVGGIVQVVTLGHARVVCNENGDLIGLPVNELAARVLGVVPGTRDGRLRGDVVLLERRR
jgi:hypothetical protein